MVIMKRITATLAAGATSLTFTDTALNSNSIIEIYAVDMDVYPLTQQQTGEHSVTATFDAQMDPVNVVCLVNNIVSLSQPALNNLEDVTLSTPDNGQILTYDGTKWVNADPSSGAEELEDLSDVDLTSPTEGQVLTYDGANWINDDPSASGEIIYSTTERVVGKWINNKPLYEITYEYTNSGISSTTAIISLTSDIVVRDIKGVLCSNDGRVYMLPYSSGNSTTSFRVNTSNQIEVVINNDSWSSSYTPWYITIQYTKTTD